MSKLSSTKKRKWLACQPLVIEVLQICALNSLLAWVVQTLDSAIHQINHYPADKYCGNQLRYPLDSDLSGG